MSSAPSIPPSEPRTPSRPTLREVDLGDRPMRVQMIVALVLGLVLVSIPLYLWRRPRVDGDPVTVGHGAPPAVVSVSSAPAVGAASDAGAGAPGPRVTVADPRVVSCGDGTKKSKSDGCDRPEALGKALSQAVLDASSCMPESAGGGTVTYVADVSLTKKKIDVRAPKDGRSLKAGKVVGACAQAVKKKLESQSFEGLAHDHGKYRVEVVATYSGPNK
ncbi:MAG: hypothetical protein JNL38_14440 [Myxococcales bacterium]|nr:hypothetical protein [Myxococcales bacterium]